MKILVIDDSNTIRKTAEALLNRAGYLVTTAVDGFESLAKIADDPPDLIFVDIMMPRLDGYQTCALIKNNRRFCHIPVVMLSSKDGVFDKARGRIVGADAYLTKPVRIHDLMESLASCLQLTWHYRSHTGTAGEPPRNRFVPGVGLSIQDRDELRRFAEIGYTKAFQAKLDSLERASAAPTEFIAGMRRLLGSFEFGRIVQLLDRTP